jgi:hypothetical protein
LCIFFIDKKKKNGEKRMLQERAVNSSYIN